MRGETHSIHDIVTEKDLDLTVHNLLRKRRHQQADIIPMQLLNGITEYHFSANFNGAIFFIAHHRRDKFTLIANTNQRKLKTNNDAIPSIHSSHSR